MFYHNVLHVYRFHSILFFLLYHVDTSVEHNFTCYTTDFAVYADMHM